ncbi:MAG: hypothetical protein K8S54_15305 [Spirochaetia bacterium]|nr:hypothetical protein [Spirochaetia bacterium]
MALVLMVLIIAVAIVSFACYVMVLIKMFGENAKTGIIGLICGIYALVWGWQNQPDKVSKNVMLVWSGAIGVLIVLQVLTPMLTSSGT